jgi:hypothetical protein
MNPFDFVNSISYNKKNLMRNTENDEVSEKEYSAYLINKALSYYTDTLLYANEMNMYPDLEGKLQYEYLLFSIRAQKRFTKWSKSNISQETLAISKYFQVSLKKAEEYRKILSNEKKQEIQTFINNS